MDHRNNTDTRKCLGKEAALSGVEACLTQFQIAPVDALVLQAALEVQGPDFEDDLQIVCAQSIGAQALVTRNASDFRHSPIPVLSPPELLERLLA